jgi:hypothetical protein
VKRILLTVTGGILLIACVTTSGWAFGIKDVVTMHKNGDADSLIVQKIQYSHTKFSLSPNDIKKLKAKGISDNVISVMLHSEARPEVTYAPYTGPWAPYWYGGPYPYAYYPWARGSVYDPYYPHVVLGLDFRYRAGYHPWHHI